MYSLIGGTTLVQNSKIVKEGNAANLPWMANSHPFFLFATGQLFIL